MYSKYRPLEMPEIVPFDGVTREFVDFKEEIEAIMNGSMTENLSNANDNYQCQSGEDIKDVIDEPLGFTIVSRMEYSVPNSGNPLGFRHLAERLGINDDGSPLTKDVGGAD